MLSLGRSYALQPLLLGKLEILPSPLHADRQHLQHAVLQFLTLPENREGARWHKRREVLVYCFVDAYSLVLTEVALHVNWGIYSWLSLPLNLAT